MKFWWLGVWLLAAASELPGQQLRRPACSMCAEWNQPQQPFRVYGNTYYVGPRGLSSILITSDNGDVLIDGAIAGSATQIADHIRQLGFRLKDVKLILNTHAHHDHAGGIAALQRMTGARVIASPWSAEVFKAGGVGRDDPQYGDIRGIEPISQVRVLHENETLHVGSIAITAHATPGHTPGGTSWTWISCQDGKCLNIVYADSIGAVSREGWMFSQHPGAVASFDKSFAFLEAVPCDVLITPHPGASSFEDRMSGKLSGAGDGGDCRKLAQDGRNGLKKRLAKEKSAKAP
jgi:metallo-beta-lactamase class B